MKQLTLLIGLVLGLSACAHKQSPEPWVLSKGLPANQALMVIDIDLNPGTEMGPQHECHIHARYFDGSVFKLAIRPGVRRYFWSAAPGRYELTHLSCGLFSRFDLTDYPSFSLKAGQNFYFGGLLLSLESRESLTWTAMDLPRDKFLSQYLSIPDRLKAELYSPFTEKKITKELIEMTPTGPSVVLGDGKEALSHFQTNWPLNDCLSQEQKINPLRGGLMHFKAYWETGLSLRLDPLETNHLYSAEFVACVERVLAETGPKSASAWAEFKL